MPKYFCIQLKRFDYDWESNRSLKFDDYFQFPRSLNVSPYIYDSLNKVSDDKSLHSIHEDADNLPSISSLPLSSSSRINKNAAFKRKNQASVDESEINYELVGVVVHSGQANAGHYYSFIKGSKTNTFTTEQEIYELEQLNQSIDDTIIENVKFQEERTNSATTNSNEKWYKFNDTSVEEVNFTDATMIEECFGGTFVSSSDFKSLPEERVRYWNAYMLFYREPDYNSNLKRNAIHSMDQTWVIKRYL